MTERKALIKAKPGLSVTRQCQLLAVPRSSAYAGPQNVSAADIGLMRQLDALYLKWPFYGSRRLCVELHHQGYRVNRKRIQRLMGKMGLRAIYPKPRTSHPGKGHKIYPYLLRGLSIEQSNQVWASDICYIPMAKGFMYLTAIIDWYSRRVLAWRVSNTLETDACVEALEEALLHYGAQRSLIWTRVPNIRVRHSSLYSKSTRSKLVWMVKAAGSTMSSLNDCGAA